MPRAGIGHEPQAQGRGARGEVCLHHRQHAGLVRLVLGLVVGVGGQHETRAGRADDSNRASAAIERVRARGLVQVPDHHDGRAGALGEGAQERQGAPHVLIAVRVHVGRQVGHQRVHDHELCLHFLNSALHRHQVLGADRGIAPLAVAVLDLHRGDALHVRARRIEAGPDHARKIVFGRQVTMPCDCTAGKEMGVNTWAGFRGSDEHAIVDGDFACVYGELQPVLKSLRAHGINIVAIHNHMESEAPRMIFLHYWGVGRADELAKAVKAALDVRPERSEHEHHHEHSP